MVWVLFLEDIKSWTLKVTAASFLGYIAQFSIEKNNVYAAILLRNYNTGKTNLVVDSRKLLNKLSEGSMR